MSRPPFELPNVSPSRPGSRRVVIALVSLAALVAVGIVGGLWLVSKRIQSRLDAAIAEADRMDPKGWRLEELDKQRFEPKEGANPADRVMAAVALLPVGRFKPSDNPAGPPNLGDLLARIGELESNQHLDDEELALLSQRMPELAPALTEARPLAETGEGRFPLTYAFNPLDTLLPDIQNAREIARLMQIDTAERAYTGDLDGALESCRAALGVARAIGDEPILISQLVRTAIGGVALKSTERAIGQGVASDQAIESLQEQLLLESKQPLALYGMRGERASSYDVLSKLESGQLSVQDLSGGGAPPKRGRSLPWTRAYFRHNRAHTLEFLNRAVDISRQPIEEQQAQWNLFKIETERPKSQIAFMSSALVYLLVPALDAAAGANVRRVAELESMVTLLAAERYRLAKGVWPEAIDDLKPYLPEGHVPIDPYSGKPILIRTTPDGFVAYSTSFDQSDNGGTIGDVRHYLDPGNDLGYRLWDVARRGEVAPRLQEEAVVD
jgi:hypothetical protein